MKYSFAVIARSTALLFVLACAAAVYAQDNGQSANPPASQPDQSSPSTTPAPQQQQTPPAAAPSQPQTQPGQTNQNNKDQKNQGTSNDRLFFALPNFLTLENSAHVPPLTTGQKFKVAFRSSFDYIQYPWYAVLAGISQAQNSEPGYGQGAEGYAKRYGAAFADGTIENFMVNAVVPSVIHTDPRYYQLGKGTVIHRTGYALSRLFITRTDSGHNTFNFAEIGGSGMAAAISTYSYHPEADKTFSNTAEVWGTQVGYDAIRIVLNEFWPDIRRKFHKDKAEPQPQPQP
ncbi:MAG TPA: hypothetical protein VN884_11285 [Candidatus Sulfotelmatobacter sp.]|nr:hypothetical protein [Candidatus Sulfotelmatobacter sp.]